ncbi:hypothetical protein IQ26_02897 [Mesorhizobium tianshanense]|uniref:Uncharacterized protein n=1 Tax=Mesorhizobium tianshanense TaxID=39844 RepID=A0A562NVY6_9HYPH|nr:hypothetical protein IQ26_02897 [Mesorhizobium tianshanense]
MPMAFICVFERGDSRARKLHFCNIRVSGQFFGGRFYSGQVVKDIGSVRVLLEQVAEAAFGMDRGAAPRYPFVP